MCMWKFCFLSVLALIVKNNLCQVDNEVWQLFRVLVGTCTDLPRPTKVWGVTKIFHVHYWLLGMSFQYLWNHYGWIYENLPYALWDFVWHPKLKRPQHVFFDSQLNLFSSKSITNSSFFLSFAREQLTTCGCRMKGIFSAVFFKQKILLKSYMKFGISFLPYKH